MKIALLLFGQLRWIDNPHTVESHHRCIIDRYHNVDVFGYFWKPEQSTTMSQSGHVAYEPSPSDPDAARKICDKYKFTDVKFVDPMVFPQADAMYNRAKARDWPHIWQAGWFETPGAFNNILCQMYTIQGVAKLLDQHILNTLTHYDFVILSRPDICIWDYPELTLLESRKFYLSNHHAKFPDLSCIFDPIFLPTFTEVFNNTINISDDELYSLWEPNAEAMKFNSFRRNFPLEYLRPISLPVRIVRGNDCRGPQW